MNKQDAAVTLERTAISDRGTSKTIVVVCDKCVYN